MQEVLRLAAPTGFSETILMRALAELLRRHPDLEVTVWDGTTDEVTEFLLQGGKADDKGEAKSANPPKKADLVLAGKDLTESGQIEARGIRLKQENVLVVPSGDVFALTDTPTDQELADVLSRRIMIGRMDGSAVHEASLKYLRGRGLNVNANDTQVRIKSLEGCMRAVAAGIGVAIVPRGTAEEICPQYVKALQLPSGPGDTRAFYVASRAGHVFTDIQKELCEILAVLDLPGDIPVARRAAAGAGADAS